MSIFRKKPKRETLTGKGKEDTKALHKIFDVLNYTPVRYGFLNSWLTFMDSAEEIIRKKLSKVSVDSLNAGAKTNGYVSMFDPWIDTMALPAFANGKEQYENHMSLIRHQGGVLQGDITRAQLQLDALKEDLDELDSQLAYYKVLEQKRRAIK